MDVGSGDVLRLDEHLTSSAPIALAGQPARADDTVTRYERIAFEDPDETLMRSSAWTIEGGGFIPSARSCVRAPMPDPVFMNGLAWPRFLGKSPRRSPANP